MKDIVNKSVQKINNKLRTYSVMQDIYTCNTRAELEDLVVRILTSKRIVTVMQELIRVNQSKKTTTKTDKVVEDEDAE